jgi:hypothetical protein
MPEVRLTVDDAVELAELLEFVRDWLDGSDAGDSLGWFAGDQAAPLLRSDLSKFVFLLGGTGAGSGASW